MNTRNFALILLVSALFFMFIPTALAQGQRNLSQGLNWSIDRGDNDVDVSTNTIHINQREPKDILEYARATTDISLPNTQEWKITFDVRFGQLRSAGSAIGIFNGNKVLGWVGADALFKKTGAFVGKDNEVAVSLTNAEWHHFEFASDNGIISILDNGKIVGSSFQQGIPNAIRIGKIFNEKPVAGQQTEIWVSSIQIEHEGIQSTMDFFSVYSVPSITNAQTKHINNSRATFISDFRDPASSINQWNVTTNGGKIIYGNGTVNLIGVEHGYPVLHTKSNPFPAPGDWTASFGYRYTSQGTYGTGIMFQDNDGKADLMLHQDNNGSFLALNNKIIWRSGYDSQWHVVSFTKKSNIGTVYLDGKQIGQDDSGLLPTAIRIGGSLQDNSWGWNNIEIQFIRIDSNERILDLTALRTPSQFPHVEPQGIQPQSVSTPIFSDSAVPTVTQASTPITKPSQLLTIGAVLGVDSRTKSPAYPTEDGHLVVTADDSTVMLPERSFVQFSPVNTHTDLDLRQVELFVNGTLTETKDALPGRPLPIFILDAPHGYSKTAHVKIIAEDAFHKQAEVLRCRIQVGGDVSTPGTGFTLQDENIKLTKMTGQLPKAMYVFVEHEYAGVLTNAFDKFSIDARRLPPGQYRLWSVTQSSDGALQPPVASTIEIKPRFELSSFAQQGEFAVDQDKVAVPLDVSRHEGTHIVKANIYVAGAYVGESDQTRFTMQIPLRDVPTGTATIEVVGVGKDGYQYPPESIAIKVQNYSLNAIAAADQRQRDLQAAIMRLADADKEIDYWYTRAVNEPDFVTYTSGVSILSTDGFSRIANVTYLDSITVPGNTGDYLGKCKAAIVSRAQIRFEIGKLYKEMGRMDAARTTFEQVINEVGKDSGLGASAVQALSELN